MAGGTLMGGRAEGPSYGRTWSKMAGGAHVAKWTDYVSDDAFRGGPALRALVFSREFDARRRNHDFWRG